MRIAHVCPACGTDLSGVRTPPDPIYHLPVAICPGCGRVGVRRMVGARWRGAGARWAWVSAGVLLTTLLGLAIIALACVGVVLLNASALDASLLARATPRNMTRRDVWIGESGPLALGLQLVAPLLAGLGMAWAMPRRRAWERAAWCVGMAATMIWVFPNAAVWTQYWFTNPVEYTPYASRRMVLARPRLELGHWLWAAGLVFHGGAMVGFEPIVRRFRRHLSRARYRNRLGRARRRRQKGRS